MTFYHLSHTDLDGYAAQLVSKFYIKDIKFYNSNYGKEISEKFNQILAKINENLEQNSAEKAAVLITDLNLSKQQCEEFSHALKDKNAKIFLLDHHQTGAMCAENFKWYFLDNSRCATLIAYEFFAKIYGENDNLCEFCKMVNAVDIWLKNDKYFEFGKVCLGLVANAKEINKIMFEELSNDYIFYLLRKANEFMWNEKAHIKLDDATHLIKKSYFSAGFDDTLSNMISAFIVKQLSLKKEKFSVNFGKFKALLTHNIGNTSVIGNDFLTLNDEFDFFIDISSKKTISLRANGKVDVSQIAAKFFGGGGHKNASGGMFGTYKDSFDYENIKLQLQNHINKILGQIDEK